MQHVTLRLRLLSLVYGLSVIGLISACTTATRDSDSRAIRSVLESQQRAWNRGDLEAFMDGYDRSDNIVFTSGGKIRRGFDETLNRYKAAYGAKKAMGILGFNILETRFLGPDAALVMGRYTLRETPKAGSGLFSLVFVRRAEGWRCIHDHTSADTPK